MSYNFQQFLVALDAEDFNNALTEKNYPDNLRRVNSYLARFPFLDENDKEAVLNFSKLLQSYLDYIDNPTEFRTQPWDKINLKNLEESIG